MNHTAELENGELLRDALVELANLRERDRRMRKSSEVIAQALQALAEHDDWESGPALLLTHLGNALGTPHVALCTLGGALEPLMGEHSEPALAACAQSESWLIYLARKSFRAMADPATLNAALGLSLPLDRLSAVLCGRLEDGERSFLLIGAETDGSRHLLEPGQQDLLRRFLPIFAQVLRRQREGMRARDTEERGRALAVAKEAAEQASRAKSEFVSRMSHELRTPLNAVIGFAELLQTEALSPLQQHYVALINNAGNHLMDLINAVLDHAKIEAGGITIEHIGFDLHETLDTVRSMVEKHARDKELSFELHVPPDIPREIVGDPMRLRQVLINLVTNAIKFTETGCVNLHVMRGPKVLEFHVRDTGIGMGATTLDRLFRPFSQGDESITRRFGGSGLGLLISRELVEAMGGHMEVESELGVGSCFRFRIPLSINESARHTAATQHHAHESLQPLDALVGGRVLLVDDNGVNQQLGAAMLHRLHLTVDVADHGLHALELTSAHRYAVVLMDMEMPEMDGLSATRALRKREQETSAPRLPVIAMTGNALAEDRQRCFDAGMDGYLAKPISLRSLEAEIRRLFSASRA